MRSVKELLSEMKDFGVLTIDLCYCSVLLGSKELAKEVIKIAKEMDKMRDEIEKAVLRAATSGTNKADLVGILRFAAYSEQISNIAAEMAEKVLEDKIHEIEKKALKDAEETFIRFKIEGKLTGMKVSEASNMKNAKIFVIKRKNDWIYHPSEKTILKRGDILFGIKV